MTARMKVLFICPTVACYIGGTETVVSHLAERIKRKADLTVLSAVPNPGARPLIGDEGLELITLNFLGRDSWANRLLSRVLMTSRFKIESYSFFRSLRASSVDLTCFDVIATFYEADAYLLEKYYPTLRARFRHLLPGVSMGRFFKHVPPHSVHFFGYRAAPRAERKWGVKVKSLLLGVDESFFPQTPLAYPLHKRLVFVGRLDKSKHVDWLVQFFCASGLAQKGYRLDIIGDGPLLERLRDAYGAEPNIRLHGRKRQDEVRVMLRDAFLLLHPTDLESFGLTILEGMAAGVPVITHALDSVRVWAGDHPRYAAHLHQGAWLKEIMRFEDPNYWMRVSAAGVTFARNLTWSSIAEDVLRVVRQEQA